MTHDEVMALVDAYAIGALDADEASDLEEHVAECPSCGATLAAATADAALLALTAPLRHHGETLKARVLRAARAPETEEPSKARPGGKRSIIERFALPVAAAAMAGIVVWAGALQLQVRDLRTESDVLTSQVRTVTRGAPDLQAVKAQAQQAMSISRASYKAVDDYQTVLNLVSAPSVTHAKMKAAAFAPAAIGDVYWDKERQMFAFMFANLPQPPEGKAYQVWLWKDGGATSGGTFAPTQRGFAIQIVPASGAGLKDFDGIGVTLEVAAGSLAPSGPVVIQLPIAPQ